MKPIFQKNLQFGDIWPRNHQKIAQIEVFGHFVDFASLVYLHFAHNDRCAWCVVVFLQFAGPVNVFLLFNQTKFLFNKVYFYDIKIDFYSIKIYWYSIKYIYLISKYIFQSKEICQKEMFSLRNFFFIQWKYLFWIFHLILF